MNSQTWDNSKIVHRMTEIAVLIAMATVLEIAFSWIPRQPQGGSISISMLPILVLTYRHGIKIGFFSGLIFGLINWMIPGFPVWVHWIEGPVDYILAYGVIGLAGIVFLYFEDNIKTFTIAAILAGLFRYIVHFFSGIFIFGEFTPEGQSTWFYSITYNGTYMVPTTILISILAYMLYRVLQDQLKANL